MIDRYPGIDWDNPTPAELLADQYARDHSRGSHGIAEYSKDEPYRRICTERAQRVLDQLATHHDLHLQKPPMPTTRPTRPEVFPIRFTAAELEALKNEAATHGLPPSTYARTIILDHLKATTS